MKAASLGVFQDVEDSVKLRVTKLGVVEVDHSFPRLTVEELSPLLSHALDGIQYELRLSEVQPKLKFIELKELVSEIAS